MVKELDVCPACGWHQHTKFCNTPCNPTLGDAAARLQRAAPDVRSTKLGYGDGQLTFEIDRDFCVGFDVRHPWNKSGGVRDLSSVMFDWQYLHSLRDLSHGDALDLVRILHDWNARCRARRETP